MRFLVFFCLMMVLFSCQKESFLDTEINSPESSDIINDQFGFLSLESRVKEISGRSPQDYVTVYRKAVLDLHAALVEQNNQYDFVDDIATKIGLPDWEHSITMRSPNYDRLTLVPIVNSLGTSSSKITGVLGATKIQDHFNIFAYDIGMLNSAECKYRNIYVAAEIVPVFEDRYNQMGVEILESGIDPCHCEEIDIPEIDSDCFEQQIQFCSYEGESWAGSHYMAPPWIDHDHDGVPNDEDQDYEEFYRRYIEPYLQQNPNGDFWDWVEQRWNNSTMFDEYGDFSSFWNGQYLEHNYYTFYGGGQPWEDFLRDLDDFWDIVSDGLGAGWGGFIDGLSWFFWDWWHDRDPCPDISGGLLNTAEDNQNNSQKEVIRRSSIECIDITFENCGNSEDKWWELLLNSSYQGSSTNLQEITSLWQNYYSDIIDLQALWVISKDCDPNGQGGQVGFEQCVQLKVQEHALLVYSEHVDLFHSNYSPSQKIGITNWLINNSNCLLPFSYDPQGGFAQCLNDQLLALSFYEDALPYEAEAVEGVMNILNHYDFLTNSDQDMYNVLEGMTQLLLSGQLDSESAYRNTFSNIDYEEYASNIVLLVVDKLTQDPSWCSTPSLSCELDKYLIGIRASIAAQTVYIHLGLDVCGMFPLAGEPCDITNGVLYTFEGNMWDAAISMSASIPFIGWASTTGKWVRKIHEYVDLSGKTRRYYFRNTVLIDGTIKFSHNGKLRKVMGMKDNPAFDLFQAHHIIPEQLITHEAVLKAAKSGDAGNIFMLNHPMNGVPVPNVRHSIHPNYTDQINNHLNRLYNDNINLSNEDFAEILKTKLSFWKNQIENSTLHVNQMSINF